MNLPKKFARQAKKKIISFFESALLSYPKRVECNICGWRGRQFLSDSWHEHINCPKCRAGIRHRLFFATLQNIEDLSFSKLIQNKKILHFAPEEIIGSMIRRRTRYYCTADLFRMDCDFNLDLSHMPEIKNGSFDIVMAFDVLEHVPKYRLALAEIHRVLSPEGFGIFTVPQKDHLLETYEDPAIVSPDERTKHFGQWDHLRIFGDDFSKTVESEGFFVTAVNETMFSEEIKTKHVLFPPARSEHPLATNYRKVYFCQKPF